MIGKISSFCYLLPVIIGLIYYRKLPSSLKIVFYVVLINGIADNISLGIHALELNGSLFLNLYLFPYALSWSYPFYEAIDNNYYKRLLQFSFFTTSAFVIYLFTQLNIVTEVNGIALAFISLHMIIVNLCYLFFTAVKSEKLSFKFHPLFFIASSLIIYHALVAVLFSLMNQFDSETLLFLWSFRSILYIILNFVITIVFWRYAKYRD